MNEWDSFFSSKNHEQAILIPYKHVEKDFLQNPNVDQHEN